MSLLYLLLPPHLAVYSRQHTLSLKSPLNHSLLTNLCPLVFEISTLAKKDSDCPHYLCLSEFCILLSGLPSAFNAAEKTIRLYHLSNPGNILVNLCTLSKEPISFLLIGVQNCTPYVAKPKNYKLQRDFPTFIVSV